MARMGIAMSTRGGADMSDLTALLILSRRGYTRGDGWYSCCQVSADAQQVVTESSGGSPTSGRWLAAGHDRGWHATYGRVRLPGESE